MSTPDMDALEQKINDAWWAWQASRPEGHNADLARQALMVVGDWLAARQVAREQGYRQVWLSPQGIRALQQFWKGEACILELVYRDLAAVLKELP